MDPTKSRPGRKSRQANQGQRVSLGLKVTAEIKNSLDAAAKQNGRTQSQEAEVRIEQSFVRQGLLAPALELAYGRKAAAILLATAHAFTHEGRAAAVISGGSIDAVDNWTTDPFAFGQATKAVAEMLARLSPPADRGTGRVSNPSDQMWEDMIKEGVAITLDAIKDPSWGQQFPDVHRNRDLEELARQTRELGGPEIIDRITTKEASK